MNIVFGADHAGFELKQKVLSVVRALGHETLDVGTNGEDPVDYPDFSAAVALAGCDKRAAHGILICGSGVGASVAANKNFGHPRRALSRHRVWRTMI